MGLILEICFFIVILNSSVFCKVPENSGKSVSIDKIIQLSGVTKGLHWDAESQNLFFIDVYNQKFGCYEYITSETQFLEIEGGPLGTVVPVEDTDDKYVAGVGTNIVLISWDRKKEKLKPYILDFISDEHHPGVRFNTGKCDPVGRLWINTVCEVRGEYIGGESALYKLGQDVKLIKELSEIDLGNGMAWDLKGEKLYYSDTMDRTIAQFDYNLEDGTISNRVIIFDFEKNNVPGKPVEMTIDSDGYLWVAVVSSSIVMQLDPNTGKQLQTIEMPVRRVTGVTFGGPELDILYVSSAGYNFNEHYEDTPEDDKDGGSVYAITGLGVKGLESQAFKMNPSLLNKVNN